MDLEQIANKINSKTIEEKFRILKLMSDSKRLSCPYNQDRLDDMVAALESVYPGQWDLYFDPRSIDLHHTDTYDEDGNEHEFHRITPSFTIHFPEFEITNSRKLVHTITDMYIKLDFYSDTDSDDLTIPYFEGKRMSCTSEEAYYSYQHSHQAQSSYQYGGNAWYFRGFCTGSGDIDFTSSRLRTEYNPAQFRLFLMQLQAFLVWESLGGVPYRYIKDVVKRIDLNKLSSHYVTNFYQELEQFYRAAGFTDLNFKFSKDYVVLKEDSNFEEFLKFKGTNPNNYNSNITCSVDDNGTYYLFREDSDNLPEMLMATEEQRALTPFYFKGELIKFEIKKSTIQIENKEFLIHPKIKQYVKQKIEQTVQEERLRGSILKQLNPS